MRNRVFIVIIMLVVAVGFGVRRGLQHAYSPPDAPAAPQRIISLAPSVTETLYALGLGPNVAGVTEFCSWPEDVENKPRVAGFSDIHVEAVVRARPDLAVLPTDKTGNRGHLESLGIPVLTLDTRTLPGLMRDIEALGKATGRSAEAEAILERFRIALAEATARSHGKRKPRVLFSIMHAYEGLGYITQINAVGRDGFYNQLIEAAGGENVYTGSLPFPRLSREAVIFLNPDVIIDVIPTHEDLEAVRRDWETLRNVNAIRNNRLYFLTDVADTVPGPRSPGTLEKLIRAFHPEEEAPATAPSAPHGAEAPHAPSAASPERNPL